VCYDGSVFLSTSTRNVRYTKSKFELKYSCDEVFGHNTVLIIKTGFLILLLRSKSRSRASTLEEPSPKRINVSIG